MPNGRPLTSGDGDNTIVIDTVPIVTSEVNKAVPSIVGLKRYTFGGSLCQCYYYSSLR